MLKDIKQKTVLKTLSQFGFEVYSFGNHIKLQNKTGAKTNIPNHKVIKGSTLSDSLKFAGIDKKEFFIRLQG